MSGEFTNSGQKRLLCSQISPKKDPDHVCSQFWERVSFLPYHNPAQIAFFLGTNYIFLTIYEWENLVWFFISPTHNKSKTHFAILLVKKRGFDCICAVGFWNSKKKGNLGWVMVRQKRDSLSKLTAYMVWIFLGGNLTAWNPFLDRSGKFPTQLRSGKILCIHLFLNMYLF